MKILACIAVVFLASWSSAQTYDSATLPHPNPANLTFEQYLESLRADEDFLHCDRTDQDEGACMKLDIRALLRDQTVGARVLDSHFFNGVFLMQYLVYSDGRVGRLKLFSPDGIVHIPEIEAVFRSMPSIRRKSLVNDPTKYKLATYSIADYFEIHDGKVRI